MLSTNSKMPPLEEPNRPHFLTLSIKSKKQPLLLSKQKAHLLPQSDQEPQRDEVTYFPVEEYKDFLKGEKIYLEVYYKNKLIISGYEPYIEVMGGEVMKRVSPSTTVVLTNEMTRQKYNKLKNKVEKICKPGTMIVSILWLQAIYRQKKKVDKDPFIFDEEHDIADNENQVDEDEDPMPDYFERQVFKQDFHQIIQNFCLNCEDQFLVTVQDMKKYKDRQNTSQPHVGWIEPMKFTLFGEDDDQKFKDLKNNKNYKYFYPQNKDKRRTQPKNQVQIKKPVVQKERKRRTTGRRVQKIQIQKPHSRKSINLGKRQAETIPQANEKIQFHAQSSLDLQTQNIRFHQNNSPKKIPDSKRNIKKSEGSLKMEMKQKKTQRTFENIARMQPYDPDNEVEKKEDQKQERISVKSEQDEEQSQADFLKRIRQQRKSDGKGFNTMWNNLMSKQQTKSQTQPTSKIEFKQQIKTSKMSKMTTPPKSESQVSERTVTADKKASRHR